MSDPSNTPPGLDPAMRRRFQRQLMLPEIGASGQARLMSTLVVPGPDADPRAAAVAADYLARAGVGASAPGVVRRGEPGGSSAVVTAPVPSSAVVRSLTGKAPWLGEAAAAVAGAFAAVEAVKSIVGVGRAGQLDGITLDVAGPASEPDEG